VPDAIRDAVRLMAAACDASIPQVIAGTVHPTPAQAEQFRRLVARRGNREPLQYLTGQCEFWKSTFRVTPDVLIPRPETEHVVEQALPLVPEGGRVVDCCTGSGCIAISLGLERPDARILATDISAPALRVAAENGRQLQAHNVRFARMDLLQGVCSHTVDVVTANPPYVAAPAENSLQPELAFEPELALFAEDDGLALIRTLLAEAPRVLKKGGHLVMEFGYNQGHTIRTLAADPALPVASLTIVKDLSGVERVGVFRFA